MNLLNSEIKKSKMGWDWDGKPESRVEGDNVRRTLFGKI